MNELSAELAAPADLPYGGLDALSAHLRSGHPFSAGATGKPRTVLVYSWVVIAAIGILFGSALANAAGVPDLITAPFATLALIIILHPAALPYLLATVIAGARTTHGPSADALWDIVFLASFTPYLLLLCWLVVRTMRTGRRRDALYPGCLIGVYVAVCEYAVLAADTVGGIG